MVVYTSCCIFSPPRPLGTSGDCKCDGDQPSVLGAGADVQDSRRGGDGHASVIAVWGPDQSSAHPGYLGVFW